MIDDNDDNANNGNFNDTLGEILSASFRVTPSLDLDLALVPLTSTPTSLAFTFSPPLPLSTFPSLLFLLLLLLGSPSEMQEFSLS